MINEYCKYTGGVDRFDQAITYYRYPHRFNNGGNIVSFMY